MKKLDMKNIINNIDSVNEYVPDEEDVLILENISGDYKDKSEDDIFVEIIRLNQEMEEDISDQQYEAIVEKLNSIRPELSEEQNKKLDKIVEALGKDRK